jgi:protein required for attachment to host cells
MTKLKMKQGTWVIVCDGRKALVLQNAGDEMFPNLQTREVHEQKNPQTHEQGTDAPGRAFNSVGHARSAMEQTDWHDEQEKHFLTDLAGRLDAAIGAGETKSIVIVAPPRALGVLRHAYSPQLKHAIAQEIDKDFVKMPVHEIEKHLVAA